MNNYNLHQTGNNHYCDCCLKDIDIDNEFRATFTPIEFSQKDLKGRVEDMSPELASEEDKDRTGFYSVVFAFLLAFMAVITLSGR